MLAEEGDSATFFITHLDLPWWKRWLGYKYIFLRLVSGSKQIKYIGFLADEKGYLNSQVFGYVRIFNDLPNSYPVQHYEDYSKMIQYRLNSEQAKAINLAYQNRDIGIISSDENWLSDIFPELDQDMNGPNFYEQLLDLRV